MINLDAFLDLMTALLNGSLSPPAFVDRFFELRAALVHEQDLAIQRNPSVSAQLAELRDLHRSGAISSDDYLNGVEAQYQRLEGLPLPPASPASAILDQLFVEVDACCQPLDGEADALAANEPELREAVVRALQQLRPQ